MNLIDIAQGVGATTEDEYGYEGEAVGTFSITFTPEQLRKFVEVVNTPSAIPPVAE